MNGQEFSDNQNASIGDQDWVFLAEIPLHEFLANSDSGDERKQGSLDQLGEKLKISPECLLKLEQIMDAFASEAEVRFKQEKIALPVSARLFCQKRMIDKQMSGGWGYFFIERTAGPAQSRSGISHHFVDLYVYQEGD